MDLKKELLKEHSIRQTRKIVDYVGVNRYRFKVLIELFLTESYRISQRSAWPLSFCVEAHPFLLSPYFGRVLKMLDRSDVHDAVKRNVVRFLQFIEIPKRHQGAVVKRCFAFLEDPKEAIAVRVFSMTVLANIAKEQPDLIKELKIIIEDYLPYGSAAYVSRAKKILKKL